MVNRHSIFTEWMIIDLEMKGITYFYWGIFNVVKIWMNFRNSTQKHKLWYGLTSLTSLQWKFSVDQ